MSSEPVKRTDTPNDTTSDYREEHPAFGQIAINRVNCGPGKFALYGAASDSHLTTVRLVISRSERSHWRSMDWYLERGRLIEIEMTPLQFADLMTNFNMGSGVPCTIRQVGGERIPDIPSEDMTEISRIREGFSREMKDMFSDEMIRAARKEMKEILSKKSLLKADRKRIEALSEKLFSKIENSLPFAMDRYVDASAKVEAEVKKEVAAFTSQVIKNAGMKAISNMDAGEHTNLLTGKVDPDDGE